MDNIVPMIMLVIYLVVVVIVIAGMWKAFEKAGQPGWACLIPFYSNYIMTKIACRPILWFVLQFIPFVNIVILIILMIDIAKNFGKSEGFGIGLFFLSFIFWPMLGFGDAQYDPIRDPEF